MALRSKKFYFFLLSIAFSCSIFSQNQSMNSPNEISFTHKIIPESIAKEVLAALSFYPELKNTPIEFKFKKHIKKSTMQAQPDFASIFKSKENRGYKILISEKFHIEKKEFDIEDVESDVLIGWFGHELGHVMDYRDRSTLGMIIFGLKYLFSKAHLKLVERTADTIAVNHGMSDYILATKNFILNNVHISDEYKARIERLYLSPKEIMEIVNSKNKSLEKEVEKEEIDEMEELS